MGLIVNLVSQGAHYLLVGTSALLDKRRLQLEEAGAKVIVRESATAADLRAHGRPEVDNVVDAVFISFDNQPELDAHLPLVKECKRLRIPVNVTHHMDMSTFSLPSIYTQGAFQLAVTTNRSGCRLANRIKRVAAAALPPNMDEVCANVGCLREALGSPGADIDTANNDDDDAEQTSRFNQLVTEGDNHQRLRSLAQMVEYYPLARLATVTLEDLVDLDAKSALSAEPKLCKKGRISLVGAGPGSAGFLTVEALREITTADYILADKLVPQEVLALIPQQTPVFIARKFPGNAERAQAELLDKGLTALEEGKHVVRLKQGDPYVYGRGAEEFVFFRERGFAPKVVPGISSALAAPVLAEIAPTSRGFADQLLIMTGTGRAGALPQAPEWVETRTTVFLMALHRIRDIVALLLDNGWDPQVACASIERASCADQRVVRSRLADIADALDAVGSRPPGLLVVGRACETINKTEGRWTVEDRLATRAQLN